MSDPAGARLSLQVAADMAGVVRAIRAARAFATRCALSGAAADRLCLVIDEWLTNAVEHGAPPAGSRLGVRIGRDAGGLAVTLTDAGCAFDPRAAPAFEGPNPDRGGGAGLELVRAWAQIADYRYARGRNRVVLLVSTA